MAESNREMTHLEWAWRAVAALTLLLAVMSLEPTVPYDRSSPDAFQYQQAAKHLVEDQTYRTDERDRPAYPPGLPVALVPFAAAGEWPDNVRVFPQVAGVGLVVLLWLTAWALAGPVAAATAGVLMALSPAITSSTTQVLADLPAALLICSALLAVIRGRHLLAGVLIGLSATVRLGHAVFALATRRWSGWVGALVVLVPLALVQWRLFGGLSSYDDGGAEFGAQWLWDRPFQGRMVAAPYRNIEFYPQLLMGRWGWLVPGLPLVAGVELWLRRAERSAQFAVSVVAINVALYLVYFYQDRRFLLPTAVLLIVFASSMVARVAGSGRAQPIEGEHCASGEALSRWDQGDLVDSGGRLPPA